MKSKQFKAWAIHTQSEEGHGYIGIGYLTPRWLTDVPVQCSGNTTAIFRTRKLARQWLKEIKHPEWGFKKARVYRVTVNIEGVAA